MTELSLDYWQNYFSADLIAWSDTHRQTIRLPSTDVHIALDVYEQAERSAPVLVMNHGAGGYSRIFLEPARALYERGYTVILPNQRGQGYSEGDRGDFTVGQFVQNIVDVAHWARARYTGQQFLLGGSVGSGLVYNAVGLGAPADAVICHNLYSFASINDTLAMSRFAPLRHLPLFPQAMEGLIRLAAGVMPSLRLPFGALAKFKQMVDDPDGRFYAIWKNDPLPIQFISLRYMRSTFTTPPNIPFEANTTPMLVINPVLDQMVSPDVTRHNYARLGGETEYIEINYGHWATGAPFIDEYVEIVDGYLKKQINPR